MLMTQNIFLNTISGIDNIEQGWYKGVEFIYAIEIASLK